MYTLLGVITINWKVGYPYTECLYDPCFLLAKTEMIINQFPID